MYQIWYEFFLNNFFGGTLPLLEWLPLTIEIASVVMSFLTLFLGILFVCCIIKFIISCFGWWSN